MTLAFATADDRDRARRELDPSTPPAELGPIPEPPPVRRATERAWVRPATSIALAAVAVTMVLAAVAGLVRGDASPIGAGGGLVAAIALGALAAGIQRGQRLALDILPSVALLGIVVAFMLAASSPGCASWLSPDFDGCGVLDLSRLVAPLVGLAAFALSLWATPQLSRLRGT
jgi:hypothetical protein